jgi:hypothetical protein
MGAGVIAEGAGVKLSVGGGLEVLPRFKCKARSERNAAEVPFLLV